MNVSICIASYGEQRFADLALMRALPSAQVQDAEVLIEHQPEGSNASSRNDLAVKASGEWLIFLDADDELAAGYVAAMKKEHRRRRPERKGVNALFTPAVSYVRLGRPKRPIFHREIDLRQANWMVIGTMIKREFFLSLGGFKDWPHGLEDWDLWSRAWKVGCEIYKVPRAIYVAHWDKNSSHHTLMRNRDEHIYWHQKVGHSNWPEYWGPCTSEEDEAKRLLSHGRVSGSLRMIA